MLDTALSGLPFVVLVAKFRWGVSARDHVIQLKSEKSTLGFLIANDTRNGSADSTSNTVG